MRVGFPALSSPGHRATQVARQRAFAADLIGTVMSSTGKAVSSGSRSASQVDELAVALGEMFSAYSRAC
jgi:hypothetical protein